MMDLHEVGLKLSEATNGFPTLPRTRFKIEAKDDTALLFQTDNMAPAETMPLVRSSPTSSLKKKSSESVSISDEVADLESGGRSPDVQTRQDDAFNLVDNYNTVTSNASFYQRKQLELLRALRPKDAKESQLAGDNSFIMVLSALYAKMLMVMGITFPISEIISPVFTASSYMGFYLYLYTGSILYFVYVFWTLFKSRAGKTARTYWNRVRSSASRRPSMPDSSRQPSPGGIRSRSGTFSETPTPKVDYHEEHGSFYLRIGAVAFGIGSMIYSGLEFGQYFEIDSSSKCHDILLAITPAARMLFTFIQMYFIFLNAKMPVKKNRTIAYFGLMHIIATNLCVWLSVIVEETKHEIIHVYNDSHGSGGMSPPGFLTDEMITRKITLGMEYPVSTERSIENIGESYPGILNDTLFKDLESSNTSESHGRPSRAAKSPSKDENDPFYVFNDECRRTDVMGSLVQDASPFLFPCAIEYSLICAAISYVLWKNTGASAVNNDSPLQRRSRHHYSVDCSKANKGLFLGIFVLVGTIISLILFFALINRTEYIRMAILQVNFSRLAIYFVTIIATVAGMISIRKLRFDTTKEMELDDILLVMGQVGVFSYNVFIIVAAYNHKDAGFDTYLGMCTALGSIIQAVAQSLFILDASRRYTTTKQEQREKPGREIVTFLLVCNFAMWSINTMEKSRTETHPIQLEFYGTWPWIVITNISMPLSIFYRFHSTVCLCEIWKRSYKVKPDY
ncbi:proton channel OtopLc-like isoform X2 [Artemia franciscana]|uniref:proton channel OtopLc-like isoform X2 n=1 Tax=Artemia franciscana TaxID=6661 RepID=UPI0032DB7D1C